MQIQKGERSVAIGKCSFLGFERKEHFFTKSFGVVFGPFKPGLLCDRTAGSRLIMQSQKGEDIAKYSFS